MKIKTIIADDEYFIRARLAKILLDNSTYIDIVALAEDGEDVIKILQNSKIDLIISDIRMIKTGGLELAKYVYENKLNTKIIIISGYNEFDYAVEAMRYGVSDYLSKPISQMQLLEAIDKCLQNIKNSKNNFPNRVSLSHFFVDLDIKKPNMDMANIRPLASKFLINADRDAFAKFITDTTTVIIENHNPDTLYKFLREIVSTLDIKYNILQNTTTAEYINELLATKHLKTIAELNKILIDLGIECMQLNIQTTKEQILCKAILSDIEKNFANSSYTVSDIAKNIGKNSSYLNAIFKKVYGYTIVKALNDYRLEKAREILRLGGTKIAHISKICGYTDMFYFSKKYKAKFGYPPSEENLKT